MVLDRGKHQGLLSLLESCDYETIMRTIFSSFEIKGYWAWIVFVLIFLFNILGLWKADRFYGSIFRGWDAQFYYSMAHSLLFDVDLDITNDLQLTSSPQPFDRDGDGTWEMAPRRTDGRIPSKYPIGLSLFEAPMLGIGHFSRIVAQSLGIGVPGAVGYSPWDHWSVAVGLIALFSLGLTCLTRLISEDIGTLPAVIGVSGCWLGTSLFYYSSVFPFMAHPTSFVLLVLAMWATRSVLKSDSSNGPIAILGVVLALTFLVRPQQGLLGLFLAPALLRIVISRPAKQWWLGATLGSLACLLAIIMHVGLSWSQFGAFTVSGYAAGGEGFAWFQPQLRYVLFSGDRGLLIFSPVTGLALLGYILSPGSIRPYVWPFLGNALAQVYLVAAWSSPGQGDSFGCRMLSDNAAVVAFGLASLYDSSPRGLKPLVGLATVAMIGWTNWMLVGYMGIVASSPN